MKKHHFSLVVSILSVITLVFLINSKAVASEFNFENKCDHPVRVAIHFMDLNGQWQQEGWWTINPNVRTYLSTQNIRLKSNNNIWYYYAETTDGSKIGWFGNQNVSFQGQMLKMLKAERANANAGDFYWSISCPATPAPAQQAGMEGLLFPISVLAFLYFLFFRRQSVITKIINRVLIALLYPLPFIILAIGGGYGAYEKEGNNILAGIIAFVFGGFIGALVTIPWAAFLMFITSKMQDTEYKKSVKEDERKRKEEQLEVERRQKEKQLESERKQKQEDDKYNRIINCPICEGNGKTYIDQCYRMTPSEYFHQSNYLASKELIDMYPNGKDQLYDGYGWQHNYRYKICPYCDGDGIASAWYGKIPKSKIECDQCQGSGQITTKIKLEMGMGDKKITCIKCNGIGSFQVPEKSVIHVKTKSGGEEQDTVEGKCEEGEKIGDYPKRFILEITKDNKELLEKSKPRTS